MVLRFPAVYRFLGLVVMGVGAPAIVIACSTEVTPVGDGTPSTTSTTPTDPPPATTPTTTSTTPEPKDAGPPEAAAKDAAPPPTDVAGSAECTAYCAKKMNQCNKTCIPATDCAIPKGQCAASTQAFLDCQTTKGQWYCGGDGFSIVHSCKRDTSLCN